MAENKKNETPDSHVGVKIESGSQELKQKIALQDQTISELKNTIEEQKKATIMLDESIKNMTEQIKDNKPTPTNPEIYVWKQINKFINR